MAFIANEIELKFQGEEYTIPMSMKLNNRIESAGVNLYQLQIEMESGGIPSLTLVSTMFSIMLQAGGAKVTADEVWEEINHGDTIETIQAARAAIVACFPKASHKRTLKKGESEGKS